MVLEVEFYVGAGENAESASKEVAQSIFDNVDASASCACVAEVPHIVSVGKRALPWTARAAAREKARAVSDAVRKAAVKQAEGDAKAGLLRAAL
jgi:hypothetical protein